MDISETIKQQLQVILSESKITLEFRKGLAADWATANPILADGEPGFETDTGVLKLGDGATAWVDLPVALSDIYGPARTVYPANTLGFLGDSISALNGGSPLNADHTPDLTQAANQDVHHVYGVMLSGGRWRWGHGVAIAGYTVQQIRDTCLPAFLASGMVPGACVVLAGTNNTTAQAATPSLLATDLAALNTIYDTLLSNGVRPIAATIPPRSDSTTTDQATSRWNVAVRNNAHSRGLDLVDYHKVLVDPVNGGYKSGLSLVDGIHPSFVGCQVMGPELANLADRFARCSVALIDNPKDNTDLLAGYGLFLVDSNADGIADGFSKIGTPTNVIYSIYTDGNGAKWQQLEMDAGASGQALLQRAGIDSAAAAGDVIEFSARVHAEGFTAAAPLTGVGPLWGASVTFRGSSGNLGYGTGASMHADITDGIWAVRVKVPTGTTRVDCNLSVTNAPAAGSVIFRTTAVSARNLTALGLV